jgi:hypothetical protein
MLHLYIILLMINKIKTLLLIGIFSISFAFADSGTQDQSSPVADAFLSAGDLLVVRPISSAVTIGSFGIFAVIAPFTEMAGCTKETFDGLVEKTGEFSFDRDLGDFTK